MRGFLWVVVAMLFVSSASAEMVLDQSQENFGEGGSSRIHNTRSLCQTFTAGEYSWGNSGYLVKVSLSFSNSFDNQAPATISVVGTSGGAPDDSNVLWQHSYANLAQNWFDVDLSVAPPVLFSGVIYGIKITSTDVSFAPPDNAWNTAYSGNYYQPGKLWEKRTGQWSHLSVGGTPYPDADAVFRTYMSEIPEPSTVILFFLGTLAALTFALQKPKKRV